MPIGSDNASWPDGTVCWMPRLLTAAECVRVRSAMDRGVVEPAEVLDDLATVDTAFRSASYVAVDRDTTRLVEDRLEGARRAIAAHFACPLAEREGTGFLRYDVGGFYRAHHDCGDVPSWPGAARRRTSVVLFLNGPDGFEGGALRLFNGHQPIDIVPRAGCLVAFPSDLLHAVLPVTRGIRDVAVDWFYRPAAV